MAYSFSDIEISLICIERSTLARIPLELRHRHNRPLHQDCFLMSFDERLSGWAHLFL